MPLDDTILSKVPDFSFYLSKAPDFSFYLVLEEAKQRCSRASVSRGIPSKEPHQMVYWLRQFFVDRQKRVNALLAMRAASEKALSNIDAFYELDGNPIRHSNLSNLVDLLSETPGEYIAFSAREAVVLAILNQSSNNELEPYDPTKVIDCAKALLNKAWSDVVIAYL